MGEDLLTVDELARQTGRTPDEIRSLIVGGEVPVQAVEVTGNLEVRVAAKNAWRLAKTAPSGDVQPGSGAAPTAPDQNGEPEAAPDREPAATSSAPMPEDRSLTMGSGEIHQLASGLADELFQRWELAMQNQFREELAIRLKSELENRQHQVQDLREEVDQRRERRFGVDGTRVTGMADRYASWERERTLVRQSRELEAMERQMRQIQQRLSELGQLPENGTVTVSGYRRETTGDEPTDEESP